MASVYVLRDSVQNLDSWILMKNFRWPHWAYFSTWQQLAGVEEQLAPWDGVCTIWLA